MPYSDSSKAFLEIFSEYMLENGSEERIPVELLFRLKKISFRVALVLLVDSNQI